MDLKKLERIREIGAECKVISMVFLDKNEHIGGRPISFIDLTFSNGQEFRITYDEFRSLDELEFARREDICQ